MGMCNQCRVRVDRLTSGKINIKTKLQSSVFGMIAALRNLYVEV